MRRISKLLTCGCCLTAFVQPAFAQTGQATTQGSDIGQPASPEANTGASYEGDIVVTAQRRSESLNKVPIAITVVTGEALRNTNATRLSDIQQFAPSVQYTETPAQPSFQIRGIGTEAYDYSIEQAVGIAVDDVNITLPRINPLNMLVDLDRVEVLRGPQGTLFGRNTTAGLISVTTKKPQLGVYSDEGHLQYGSRGEVQVYDIVNVPISPTLAARFNVGYQTSRSPIHNLAGPDIPDRRDYVLSGKLLWQPTDQLSVSLIGDYQNSRGDSGTATVRSLSSAPGTTYAPGRYYGAPYGAPYAGGYGFIAEQLALYGVTAGADNRDTAIDTDNLRRTRYYGGQLGISYELAGGATVTSLTAYRRESSLSNLEVDQTPLAVLDDNSTRLRAHQFTQELRIASPSGGSLDYVGGLYFYQQRTHVSAIQAGTLGLVPNNSPIILEPNLIGGQDNTEIDSKSYAAFGQATYHLSDSLRLLAGARVTQDNLTTNYNVTPVSGICGALYALVTHNANLCQFSGSLSPRNLDPVTLPTAVVSGHRKHTDWSGRAGFEYDITPGTMAYFTVSRGYKGAAISTVSGYVFNVDPETVTSYEAGLKAQLLQHRLGLTLALFRSDFKNYQAEVFDPTLGVGSFRTGNAGSLRTQGVEAEFTARPFTGLSLSGGLTYDSAKFGRYDPPCYSGMTAAQGCDYSTTNPTFDATGDRLTNAPEWSASLNGRYDTRITDALKAFATVNWSYRSAVLYQVGDEGTRQKGYGLTNVNVGVGDPDDHVRLSVYVRNLFDRRYASKIYSTLFDVGGYSQVLPDNAFRRIGAALDWRF